MLREPPSLRYLLLTAAPVIALLISSGTGCSSLTQGSIGSATTAGEQVIVLSLDALRPEFLDPDSGYPTPTLKALAKKGALSQDVVTIYPSITYPSHTTLATGAYPDAHGIQGNRVFQLPEGPSAAWYWEASRIRTQTLWHAAMEAGKTVALLNWPVSAGAQVTWLVPEIFPEDTFALPAVWLRIRQNTEPKLFAELTQVAGPTPKSNLGKDQWFADAAAHLLRTSHPGLLMLHLADGDLVQHFTGKESTATYKIWAELDRMVASLLKEIDLTRACLFVLGDHGFADVTRLVHINTLFARQGWLQTDPSGKLVSWKVIADLNGAQASVYIKDPALKPAVEKLLRANAKDQYRVLKKEELQALHTFPQAEFGLEPYEGVAIGGKYAGSLHENLPSTHGEHGYAPDQKQMHTALLAVGNCAAPGKNLGTVRLIDVAPTLAQTLGVKLRDAQGTVLPLK